MKKKMFVALLRGINVGGNKKVPMKDLKIMMEDLGYTQVKTILASGNVVFEASESSKKIQKSLEEALKKTFGFSVGTQIFGRENILQLLKENPFKGIPEEKHIKRYVSFTSQEATLPQDPEGTLSFTFLGSKNGMIYTVLDTQKSSTPDLMKVLDKNFGKEVTTRTWKTLERIVS